jgi:uncharacterized lipoprotein YmbA
MRSIAFVLSTALLFACAGTATERTLYLLRAEPTSASGRIEAPVRIGMNRVTVAPYLDQAGIIVETATAQVRAAREHRWAEPLDEGLRSLLRAEISRALGYEVGSAHGGRRSWDYTVDVYIDRMHGTMAGVAVLDAFYRITPAASSGGAVDYRFSRSVMLTREGYPGLVEAQQRLALELAEAIAGSLREVVGS